MFATADGLVTQDEPPLSIGWRLFDHPGSEPTRCVTDSPRLAQANVHP